jgi:DNA segregation ATPase FtsK/SpoIIIE-like protein
MVFSLGRSESLFSEAARLARHDGVISISKVQRVFSPGYRRAADIVDLLIAAGIVRREGPEGLCVYVGGVV